ncbi:hypothetical protein I4U23_027055 [Adineta vaga]|nr:hypothetical protein I4U23_027055 [Adineta vaga]
MSSNTSVVLRPEILSQYLSLSLGFIILLSGLIGNILIIIIFISYDKYQTNVCSYYMLMKTIFNLLFLLIGLITRILAYGFYFDLTLTNRFWCKCRSSLLDIISFYSLTCLCLQSIDIYFSTSQFILIRQRSNMKNARYLLIIFIIFWIIHEIPSFIYQDLISYNEIHSCQKLNFIYEYYHSYGATLFLSICLPIMIIIYFLIRIFQQLKSLNIREENFLSKFSKQIMKMSLVDISIVLLFQFPFGIVTAYFTTTKTLMKSSEQKLIQTFFNLYVYGLYACSFYCYYGASKQFRRHVHLLSKEYGCISNVTYISNDTQIIQSNFSLQQCICYQWLKNYSGLNYNSQNTTCILFQNFTQNYQLKTTNQTKFCFTDIPMSQTSNKSTTSNSSIGTV